MIVNCIVYRDGKRLREADIDEIGDLLRQPDTFVWLGLHEPDGVAAPGPGPARAA
jgi:magnesium transporter